MPTRGSQGKKYKEALMLGSVVLFLILLLGGALVAMAALVGAYVSYRTGIAGLGYLAGAITLFLLAWGGVQAWIENNKKDERRKYEQKLRNESREREWKREQEQRRRQEESRQEAARTANERDHRISELLHRDDVVDHIHYMGGLEFEQFMADLFRKQGYSVKRTPGSGDQGIDLLVDMEGRNVAIQLKRWRMPVGNKAVQETFTGMFYHQAQEGWLITTSSFTKSAKDAASKTGVRLIDGSELAEWMRSLPDEQ
jgi:restriction system protein